ncbi:MFS transporter [Roseomonas sp. BN140053]|uniref:MFS transporter n=1 Tax=Roseomonas sp. BN140053 TaxID=3391898 RepID=UPI0039EC79A7
MSEARLPWRVPAALAVTQVVQWGTLFYSFSLLMPAIIGETGWGKEVVVGAFSAGLLAEAGAAMLVGWLLDRVGARWVMTAGSLASAAGLWLAGQIGTVWQLYAAWILIGATMPAALYQAAFAAVTTAFGAGEARRGIAVVAFAGGLASTVFWPATGLLVQVLGWREACSALAAMNLACALPHLLMPGAASPVPGAQDSATARGVPRWSFSALICVYAAMGVASATIAVHLVPLLQDKGLGSSAALLASLVGCAQVAGRLMEFAAGARLSLRAVTALALTGVGTAFAALALGQTAAVLGIALILYGAANGVLTIMRGALPAHLFDTRRYGSVSGVLSAANAVARAAGPVAIAWSWESTGGYASGMMAVAVLCLGAIILLWAAMAALEPAL